LGRLQIILAAVLWSTSGFFAKSPWFDGWPEETRGLLIGFWRSFFSVLFLLPFVRRWSWHRGLIPMSIAFAVMVWSFMEAMVRGPAANAIWLQYLFPAWVTLYAVFIQKHRCTAAELRMVGFCLCGVLLILVMEMRSDVNVYATLLGILAGISLTVVIVSMQRMPHMDACMLTSVNHAVTVIFLAPWAIKAGYIGYPAYTALAFFGVLQMSLPYVLFARALRTVRSTEASVLALIEPILLPIWVFIAWRNHPNYEPPQWWTIAGAGLILVGLLSRYLPIRRRDKNNS
jgi:drug/metabolite transporter, DME family